jgi:hypothetical protein
MKELFKYEVLTILFLFLYVTSFAQEQSDIKPGEIWPDTDGYHIQAHGGGIVKIKNTYYWYGEERRKDLDKNFRDVSCYSSKDLVNWKHKGFALNLSEPDSAGKGGFLKGLK